MTKDPSFLFYSSDFITGTMLMSNEQVGKYIKLLCLQHQTGHLSKEDMLNICGTYDKRVFSKFIVDKDGLYYNERLEAEVNKRNLYCQSRRKNRNISSTYVQHMEDEDEDILKKEEYEEKTNGYITPEYFNKFWKVYPKKTDKGKALTKWNQLCTKKDKRPTWVELKSALLDQIKSERWQDKQFIPMPTTWLNQSRWLDDPSQMITFKDREENKCPLGFIFGKDYNTRSGCKSDCPDKDYGLCKIANSKIK